MPKGGRSKYDLKYQEERLANDEARLRDLVVRAQSLDRDVMKRKAWITDLRDPRTGLLTEEQHRRLTREMK